MLLEDQQVGLGGHPAARRAGHVDAPGLFHGHLVGVGVERAQAAGGALGEQDPDQLARAGAVVVEPGVHEHLLDAGGGALVAAVPDVVEQRAPADRARMRLQVHPRQLEPVIPVCGERQRVVVGADQEEVARRLGRELDPVG